MVKALDTSPGIRALGILAVFAAAIYASPIEKLIYWPVDQLDYWHSVWSDKWFYLSALGCICVAWTAGRKTHPSLGLYVGYALLSGLYAFAWRFNYAIPWDLQALKLGAAYSTFTVLLFAVVLPDFNSNDWQKTEVLISSLCFFNAVLVFVQWGHGVPAGERGGLFGNPSISGCFTSATIPILWSRISNT